MAVAVGADGLGEAHVRRLFEKRVVQQVQDDIMLVRQARGTLPEALVLCLCPRGRYRVESKTADVIEVHRYDDIEIVAPSAGYTIVNAVA